MTRWLYAVVESVKTFHIGDQKKPVTFLIQAVESFEIIRNGQRYNTRGGKKLDIENLEERTREKLKQLQLNY